MVICLVAYLLVLVPLNWMLFHAIGRVEWAWFAVPVIAILATLLIVWQAQLDIGFVRSQTEVAILELSGSYPRGHLSRYTALYTSLASIYDVQFDDPHALAAPFPVDQGDPPHKTRAIESVTLRKGEGSRLQGLAIPSTTTRMVHSEQMITLQGPIAWNRSSTGHRQVTNRTEFDLTETILLHRQLSDNGKTEWRGCWLGPLRSGQSAIIGNLEKIPNGPIAYTERRARAAMADHGERINLKPLLKLATSTDSTDPSPQGQRAEIRLIARIAGGLPGIDIAPSASQMQRVTLVVAHLQFGPLPEPQPDVNHPKDLKR